MSDSLFRPSQTLILRRPIEVEAYLRQEIGFELRVVLEALERGGSEAAMTTPHNAASSFGYRRWDGMVAGLRDQLVPHGWTSERPGGLEMVRRADNRVQITGSLGDSNVGNDQADPSCQHEKGESSDAAMRTNQLTLDGLVGDDPTWKPILSWWVLYRFAGLNERRVVPELSLPREGVAGHVSSWAVRILLPEFEVGGGDGIDVGVPPESPPPIVSVRRVGT
jgi:hypothetical protein